MKSSLSVIAAASLLASISSPALAKKPKPEPAPEPETATLVLPIPAGQFGSLAGSENGYNVLDKFVLPKIGETGVNLEALQGVCNLTSEGKPLASGNSVFLALFGAILKPLFGFMFHKADKALDKKIEAYKAEWLAGTTTHLFRTDAKGALEPAYRCIRVVRVKELPKTEGDVAQIEFDALFLMHWVPRNTAWQLVPLRVATTNPVARGEKVSFAMSIAGSTAGTHEGRGKVETIAETVILKGKYKPKADLAAPAGELNVAYPAILCDLLRTSVVAPKGFAAPKDMAKADSAACAIGDPPPFNALVDNVTALPVFGTLPTGDGREGDAVNLAFKVAEAGKGPRLGRLEDWKVYLGKAGDGISDALTSAASDLIDGKD